MTIVKASIISILSALASSYPHDGLQVSTSSLTWGPCELEFPPSHQGNISAHGVPIFCANLTVPLDYTNVENGEILELNLVKVEASKPRKGSIMMNPGGPGSSGVEEISKHGPMYRDIFGGFFDVIGFDAR